MGWVKFEAFRCLNSTLLISGLIAFRMLINHRLSMGSIENEYIWGYVLMLMGSIK
jgi:hypothetical protein